MIVTPPPTNPEMSLRESESERVLPDVLLCRCILGEASHEVQVEGGSAGRHALLHLLPTHLELSEQHLIVPV